MPQAADDSTLSDRHYVTLILRLTLDQAGDLIKQHSKDEQEPRWFRHDRLDNSY